MGTEVVLVRNISAGGVMALAVGARAGPLPPPGEQVDLKLEIGNGTLELRGKMAWAGASMPSPGGQHFPAFGLQFVAYDDATKGALEALFGELTPVIAWVTAAPEVDLGLLKAVQQRFQLRVVVGSDGAIELLEREEISVLVLGTDLVGEAARDLLEHLAGRLPHIHTVAMVLAAGPEPELFQDLVDADRLFYLSPQPLTAAEIVPVLGGAIEHYRQRATFRPGWSDDAVGQFALEERVLHAVRRLLLQREVGSLLLLAEEAVCELTPASRALCRLFNVEHDTLWRRDPDTGEDHHDSAASGITGFVARTALSVGCTRASTDPRYERSTDDPQGNGDESLLVQPVLDSERHVIGVVVAVRDAGSPPFAPEHAQRLKVLCSQMSSAFGQAAIGERLS
jgi:hypothetical protein